MKRYIFAMGDPVDGPLGLRANVLAPTEKAAWEIINDELPLLYEFPISAEGRGAIEAVTITIHTKGLVLVGVEKVR